MTPDTPARLWKMRAAFVLLTLAILFANLLPLKTSAPTHWAGLDLLLVFAMAWSVRRPDYVPIVILALLFLLADFLLQRPPGLWALLTLMACERLRGQAHILRDAGAATEYLNVSALIIGVYLLNRLILGLVIVDLPPLGLYLLQMIATLAAYPFAVFLTHVLMGVRKLAPSDGRIGGTGT